MKKNIERRLEQLEERRKPRVISTLADLVLWRAKGGSDEDVELTPQMQAFVDETLKHIKEKDVAESKNNRWPL
jgi:hypothetical protein